MRSSSACVVLVCSLLCAAPTDAKEPLTLRGTPGVWLSVPELDAVAQRIESLEDYLLTQDKLVLTLKDQVATSSATIGVLTDINKAEAERGDLFNKMYREEVVRNAAWHKQPVFWVIVGTLVAGGVATGVAFGVSN